MEQGTKRCPYCGEEILAVAKKCKYCGEWLEEDDQNGQQQDMADDFNDSYDDNHKGSIIFEIVYKLFYRVGIGYAFLCFILHHFYDVNILNGWVAGIGVTIFGIMTLYGMFKGD